MMHRLELSLNQLLTKNKGGYSLLSDRSDQEETEGQEESEIGEETDLSKEHSDGDLIEKCSGRPFGWVYLSVRLDCYN